ncbi:hypothetical protein G7054_g1865 [Neopestalotiopsis clavispora]|nr:hypothetical protein G7054_g1865 [Neopestalotiopsis clavispora]
MTSRTQQILSAAALLGSAVNGHMIMKTPTPFGGSSLDNSPLTSSNYPCKVTSDPSSFYSGTTATEMAIGETQTLSFTGSAVHGGGSCQLAVTSDAAPDASTNWQVILSIESGCPSTDGTAASTYDFTIPDGIAAGDYVFAWTWVSKLSGTQEFYMNCAPITVTGSSSKRSVNESMELLETRDTFPDLFVANLADINDCKTVLSSDVEYPEPGSNLQKLGSSPVLAAPSGTNCYPKGSTGGSTSGDSSDSGSGTSAGGSTATSAAGTVAASEPATSAASSATEAATSAATSSAGGFITSTVKASTASSAAATTAKTTAKTSSAAAAASSSASTGGSTSSGGESGACTSEGTFNCVGGSQYQQCASGAWTTLQAMPEGTTCQEGESTSLWARKEARSLKLRPRRL